MSPAMIEQALHGYDRGHRLLASSVDLTSAEVVLTDRLSDLSGFLPPGTEVPPYLTIFPCGRFYALARTWPDLSGTRRGTVLTHTLLVSLDDVSSVEDLEPLLELHREPRDVGDRASYQEPLASPTVSPRGWRPVDLDDPLTAVTSMLFGGSRRPVVVVADSRHEDVVTRVWRLLWPTVRVRFAACNFALGVRKTERGPFDLLIAPSSARPSFVDVAKSASLWDSLRSAPPPVPGVHEQAWFEVMKVRGPSWRDDVVEWCERHALSAPSLGSIARFERMRALDTMADTHITAARSRLDALVALWPALSGNHPWLRENVRALVGLQEGAPDVPSPLRSLLDLVSRPEVARVAAEEPAEERVIVQVIRREVVRRVARNDAALEELTALEDAVPRPTWQEVITEGIVEALAQADTSEERFRKLTLAFQTLRESTILSTGVALLEVVDHEERAALLDMYGEVLTVAYRDCLFGHALRLGVRDLDAALIARAFRFFGDAPRGIRQAIGIILGSNNPSVHVVSRIEALPLEGRIDWCLGRVCDPWRPFAVENGARWVRECAMPPVEVARRCAELEHGADLFVQLLVTMAPEEVRSVLRQVVGWAPRIVAYVLASEVRAQTYGHVFDVALSETPGEVLLDDLLYEALCGDNAPLAADRVAAVAGPILVRRFATGQLSVADARVSNAPSIERWMVAHELEGLRSLVAREEWRESLPQVWGVVALLSSGTTRQRSVGTRLLTVCIREADRRAFDEAFGRALEWFSRTDPDTFLEKISAEILVAVRRTEPRSASGWIEACFPIVYPPLRAGVRNPFGGTPWRPGFGDWDHAGHWREWLTRTWISHEWSPHAFLRIMRGDQARLDECLGAVRFVHRAYEFVESLCDAARKDAAHAEMTPVLLHWRDVLMPLWKKVWIVRY